MGLFFKCLSNKTLTFNDHKCIKRKYNKEILFCYAWASLAMKKVNHSWLGKKKNSKCLKDANSLEVDYDFSKKSWMKSDIFY